MFKLNLDDKNTRNVLTKIIKKLQEENPNAEDIEKKIHAFIEKFQHTNKLIKHIGVHIAQSLCQPITQKALSSFKKTGTSEFSNFTNIKNINNLIYDKNNVAYISIHEDVPQKDIVVTRMVNRKIKDLLQERAADDTNNFLIIDFHLNLLSEFKIHLKEIVSIINANVPSYICSVNSYYKASLKINKRLNTNKIAELALRMSNVQNETIDISTVKNDLYNKIKELVITGEDNVISAQPTNNPCIFRIQMNDLLPILTKSYVNVVDTTSTDIDQIETIFGIEATRYMIINNIHNFTGMPNVYLNSNINIIASYITKTGKVSKVNLMEMYNRNFGILRKMSFENAFKAIKLISTESTDTISEVSSKVICGTYIDE